jgi:capsular exopolysaccharide synthesis family protein
LKRYFPSIKQYSWVILVSFVIALIAGVYLSKITPATSSVNSIMLATVGAPGTTIPGVTQSGTSLDAATNYSSEIVSRSVMDYVVANNSRVAAHYSADDLLYDIVAVPSTTAATVTITATTTKPADSVLLANAVSEGFQNYIQSQRQAALNDARTKLTSQLSTDVSQKNKDQATMQQVANTTDIRYILASQDLQNVNQQINNVQSQINQLPSTVNSDIIVIQKAKLIDVSSSSKGTLVIAAAGAVGILIGILIMFLMIFLDDRLYGEDRVKEKLGMAYIGGLFIDRSIKKNAALAKGAVMHQFADMVVNLRLTGVLPGEWRIPKGAALLITSAQSAEGKTSIAAGIAGAVARGGGSVVVVDGNVQKPTTHLAFGISNTGAGLTGLLRGTGNEPVDSVVVRSNIPGVWVLPAGNTMEDSTLLLRQRFPGILAQLRIKTDLIIIDGPDLLRGSDAMLLATMVDGVALVLDSRHDKLKILLRAKDMLSSLTHTPSGVILNRMPRRKHNSYFVSAPPADIPSEQVVSKQTYSLQGNSNGNASQNGGSWEKVAAAPSMPVPVSMNGVSLQPGQLAYPPAPTGTGNGYVTSPAPTGIGNGYAMPPSSTGTGNGYAASPVSNGTGNPNKKDSLTSLFGPNA